MTFKFRWIVLLLILLGLIAIAISQSNAALAACTAGQPPAGTVCAAPPSASGPANYILLTNPHIPSGIDAAKIGGGSVSTAEYDLLNGITSFGQSIIDDANEAAFKATVNLEIGVDVQAFDSDLSTWAGLTPSANAQSLVTAANYAAMRALLDLEAGTDFYSIAAADAAFQPLDADLTSWAGVTRASGFDTFVATPSSANFAALVTNETGSGLVVLATDPDISISATTEGNIEAAIDTLANLTSIQGQSFTMGAYAPTLLNTANEAGFKSATNLEIGVDVQAWDADLDSLSSAAFSRATSATASFLRLLEDTDNGTNYIEFISPAVIGTNRQCILVDGAAPIPDSCVGDGVDDGAGGGLTEIVQDTTPQLGGNLDLNTFNVGDADAADLTKLSEITATSAELNFVDGVTSAIQTQIDGKQPLDADLTSWSGVTRASGFDTFVATPSSANARGLFTDELGTGPAMFGLHADMSDDLGCTASQLVRRNAGDTAFECFTGGAGGISNVVEDTDPELGGNLNTNTFDIIVDAGDFIRATDATGIVDENSNEQLIFQTTTSAVNHLEVQNAATNSNAAIDTFSEIGLGSPIIRSVGDNTNVGLIFEAKSGGANQNYFPFVFQVDTAQDFPALLIKSTHTGNGGPGFISWHDSSSPALDDQVGFFEYQGRDSAANAQYYAGFSSRIIDPTSGSEDGSMDLETIVAGTRARRWKVGEGGHFQPHVDATYDIGTTTIGINDIHFGSGGIINFDGGDITFTHSANLLTMAGGDLSLGTAAVLTTGSIELGAASDTTLARVSAGTASIEGQNILTAATGQPLDADLTSIAALTTTSAGLSVLTVADPGGHRALGWDDTGNAIVTKTLGGGLTTDADSIDCGVATDSAQGCAEFATTAEAAAQTATDRIVTPAGLAFKPESLCVAASDETTDLTTGTAKVTFRMPYAFTLTNVRGSVNDAAAGTLITVDINENGSTIMTTNKLTIDIAELTSVTAATAPGITDSALADDAEMKIDIDGVGTTAKGLKVCLIGHQ